MAIARLPSCVSNAFSAVNKTVSAHKLTVSALTASVAALAAKFFAPQHFAHLCHSLTSGSKQLLSLIPALSSRTIAIATVAALAIGACYKHACCTKNSADKTPAEIPASQETAAAPTDTQVEDKA